MKAVLMAGGFGTRIQPLTNSLPKPMLPVLNRPMMEHILLKLRDMGISEVVVLLYFKPEVIQNYFGDGSRFGMTLHYVLPDDDYGTAGAVKKAQPYLDETFIIVSGDLVTDFDFAPIVEFHRAKASKLTLALTPVPDPLQFGVVIASPEGKIQKFLEKPAWGEVFSDTINTGIYILEPEVLDYIPEGMAYDFAKDLFPQMMKEGETLWAKTVLGYWRDVGNPESYRDVHADLLTGKVASSPVGHRVEYKKGVLYHGEGCLIPDDLYVEGLVILGDGVTIDREVELTNVVIGNRVRLDKRVKITGGVIWNDVYIGEKSTLVNVVICNDCRLGKKVKAKSGVIIAEGCEIGSGVSFERDVIVWPSKFIDEGSIVSNNIIWGDRYKTTIFEGGKVTGRTNMELSCDISVKLAEAFGSMLPVGSTVYVSRDYHNSSRMLKRAFLGGLLSTGVNVVDFKLSPSNVTRFHIAENKEAVAGIHFRRSVFNPMKTEILFFNESGLPIDTNTEKNCERIFFRENFRRVDFDKIGMLTERSSGFMEEYVRHFMTVQSKEAFAKHKMRVVIDIMHGSAASILPDILSQLGIENIILNAYQDARRQANLPQLFERSGEEVSKIVQTLRMDLGLLIYPNGQRLELICDNGIRLSGHKALLATLYLLHKTEEAKRVYLPVWAPDIADYLFDGMIIERGKQIGMKVNDLMQYDFIGTGQGSFIFREFSLISDAIYAGVKIMQMLAQTGMSLSEVLAQIPDFYYLVHEVHCPARLKGKMMRKFREESEGHEASFVDGVKIRFDARTWILMIPDQHADSLHLFVQSDDAQDGEALYRDFIQKIERWIAEDA